MRRLFALLVIVLALGCGKASPPPAKQPVAAQAATPTAKPLKLDPVALKKGFEKIGFQFEAKSDPDDPARTWDQARKDDEYVRILSVDGRPTEVFFLTIAAPDLAAARVADPCQLIASHLLPAADHERAASWLITAVNLRRKETELHSKDELNAFPWVEFVGEIGDLEIRCSRKDDTNVLRFVFQPLTVHGAFRPGNQWQLSTKE